MNLKSKVMEVAIIGHPTRGKEVIQLLEMLGGKPNGNMDGYNDELYYFIAKDGLIYGSGIEYEELVNNYTIFTLEDFLEKFPYMIGDIVKCHSIWKGLIESMEWYEGEVLYSVSSYFDYYSTNVTAKYLQPYEEELTMKKKSKLINIQPKLVGNECVHFPIPTGMKLEVKDGMCYLYRDCGEHLEEDCKDIGKFTVTDGYIKHYKREGVNLQKMERKLDEALEKETTESLNKWLDGEPEPEPKAPILSNRYDYAEGKCGYVIPDGYEFDYIKEGFQTEIILKPKKPTYPKDYEECRRIIDYHLTGTTIIGYEKSLLENFQQLLICRDAYWKIAGEQMGLEKPWEPDWKSENEYYALKYTIITVASEILVGSTIQYNAILAFPTAEMRDAFCENFKDLINECKELL